MSPSKKRGEVLIGTASWTDKTLLASGWYPDDAKTPEKRLAFYASHYAVLHGCQSLIG